MLYLFCYKALVALFLLKALWRCSGKNSMMALFLSNSFGGSIPDK
jgi:hypothetical protein